MDRLSGILIPDDRCLTLVCDTDRRDVLCGGTDHVHRLYSNPQHTCPDLVCIVLYPARLREVLGKLSLRYTAHLTFFVEQDTSVAGCPRVECHYILCHTNSSFNIVFPMLYLNCPFPGIETACVIILFTASRLHDS